MFNQIASLILHSRMHSPEAVPAVTAEMRGQNSWVNYGQHGEYNHDASGTNSINADQKSGIMSAEASEAPPTQGADVNAYIESLKNKAHGGEVSDVEDIASTAEKDYKKSREHGADYGQVEDDIIRGGGTAGDIGLSGPIQAERSRRPVKSGDRLEQSNTILSPNPFDATRGYADTGAFEQAARDFVYRRTAEEAIKDSLKNSYPRRVDGGVLDG